MYLCYFVNVGINIFLDGFVPTENLRFRDTSLVFKVSETADWVRFLTSLNTCDYIVCI